MKIERMGLAAIFLLLALLAILAAFVERPASPQRVEAPSPEADETPVEEQPGTTATPATDRATMVPLGQVVADIHPQEVWGYFYQLTRIEALFTVSEEDGLDGILGLETDLLRVRPS